MLGKDIKVFLKKKKKKRDNIVMNDTKMYQKMRNKIWLSIENKYKMRKKPYYNYQQLFSLRKIGFLRQASGLFLRVGLDD